MLDLVACTTAGTPGVKGARFPQVKTLDDEELVEVRAPEDATTPHDELATLDWSRRWPIEEVWKARKVD